MITENKDLSSITQLILNFYNVDFDKNTEKELKDNKKEITDTEKKDINNFFFKKKPPLEEKKRIIESKKKFPTINSISKINFIKDKKLFDKIMKYKLLEIKKQIVILELIYVTFKNNLLMLLHEDATLKKGENNENCLNNLRILIPYIKDYIVSGQNQLNSLLGDYAKLDKFFNDQIFQS
jgi:hypothetical protein